MSAPERIARTPTRGTTRVWILNGSIAVAALALYLLQARHLTGVVGPVRVPWWLLAGLFYLAEVYVVHLQLRRDAHSFSLSEVPLVLGLFFVSPSGLVLAQMTGAAAALIFHRRQSPMKAAFNITHLTLEAVLASVVFRAIITMGDPLGPAGWIASFLATLTTSLVGALLITLAIGLYEGDAQMKILPKTAGFGVVIGLTNTCLALMGVTVLWRDPKAAWLLAIPCALLFIAYRTYTTQRHKHESLEALYETSRVMHRSLHVESVMLGLLQQVRKMFRADIAAVTLFPTSKEDPALRSTLGPGEDVDFNRPVELDPKEGAWARVAAEDQALLLPRPIQNDALRKHYEARGIRDAMVAPLHGETGVVGTMLVGNRFGDVSTFDHEDLKLFETLANHASVSLENAGLVARLEESLAHLTEMNRLKDEFVGTVSHELRTPLTSIQGSVKTLRLHGKRLDQEAWSSLLEAADRQGDRLRHLIEDLLVASRIESQEIRPIVTTVSLPVLARQVVDEFGARALEHTLEVEFAEDIPLVQSDQGKIHQIVSNLVDNALKYSPEGAKVSVKGRAEGDGVVVTVSDEGYGVPPELQEAVFDRFYQVDQSSTRVVGGTGLGLYICRKLAEALGGRVWLEHSGPGGSTFSLWIPRLPPAPLSATAEPKVAAEDRPAPDTDTDTLVIPDQND